MVTYTSTWEIIIYTVIFSALAFGIPIIILVWFLIDDEKQNNKTLVDKLK